MEAFVKGFEAGWELFGAVAGLVAGFGIVVGTCYLLFILCVSVYKSFSK